MHRPRSQWIAALCAALLSLASAFAAEGSAEETKQLIEILQSDQGVFEKAKACQRLAIVGTADAVPALAALLSDEKLAHYARFGLEPIEHPSVDEALRAALERLEGELRIGVINSIGARRDVQAQDALIALLGSTDRELAVAAAAGLGRIGALEGADALLRALGSRSKELGIRLGEAAVVCGEVLAAAGKRDAAVSTFAAVRKAALPTHVRAAALRGEVLASGDDGIELLLDTIRGDDAVLHRIAFGVARELPGRSATRALVDALDGLAAKKRVQVLRALADRGDRAALPAVLALAAEEGVSDAPRVAAIRALETLGDAAAVPSLVGAASGDNADVAAAAFATLAEMGGEDVDGATLALLEIALRRGRGERGMSFLRTMIQVAGSRKIASSVRLLTEAAGRDEESIRLAAIRSLGTTVGLDDFGALVDRLASSKGDAESKAIRDALGMASRRMPSPGDCSRAIAEAMAAAPNESKAVLLSVLSAVGGAEALDVVARSARASEASVRHAALATLGEWPHESAVAKLLEVLPTMESADERTRAYDAFRSIVRRLGFDRNRRIGSCVEAMDLAKTDEERRLTISALEGIPAPRTLNILAPHLESDALGDAAASAIVTICERLIRTRQRGAVAPAIEKVLAATEDADLVRRAKALAKQASGN